jgi:tetratricopeptide (TPR) repeat protein
VPTCSCASATSARNSGTRARSLEFADRALVLDPKDWRALWLRGAALFSTNRAEEALPPLERACELDSTQLEVLRTTARVAESLQRPEAAERAWRRIVWVDDEDGEAWFQIAASEARRGDLKAAEVSLARASELNPVRPGLLFLRGWVKENLGRPDEAIALYREHLSVHVDDIGTRRRLVGLYMRVQRYPEAYEEAKRVAKADPDRPEALQVLADLAFRTKHDSEGDRAINQSARAEPGRPREHRTRRRGAGAKRPRGAKPLAWPIAGPPIIRATRRGRCSPCAPGRPRACPTRRSRAARLAVAAAPDSTEPRRLLARSLMEAKRSTKPAASSRTGREVPARTGFPPGPGRQPGARRRRGRRDRGRPSRAEASHPSGRPRSTSWATSWPTTTANSRSRCGLIEKAIAARPRQRSVRGLARLGALPARAAGGARAEARARRRTHRGGRRVREHLGDVYRDMGLPELAREQYRVAQGMKAENVKRVEDKLRAMR